MRCRRAPWLQPCETRPSVDSRDLGFRPNPPATKGVGLLSRTDPSVAAIARHVLEAALDPAMPGTERPARRAGVIRTDAVDQRTTVLLVRYRFHLDLPSRSRGMTSLVAEDCDIVGFRGSPARATWVSQDEAMSLLAARAVANLPADQAGAQVHSVLAGLPELTAHLDAAADAKAAELAESHLRVRQGSAT